MSTPPFSPASAFARSFIDALVALGIEHAVVSPGSRSQALALELAERELLGGPRLHVRIDERSGSFTALGIGKESGVPALVVCTSGTAAGNMLPAVMEASHAGVPLIVVTADRPAALRGTGSSQTTWQEGIFGRFPRLSLDVEAPAGNPADEDDARALAQIVVDYAVGTAGADGAGPVHVNLQQREPLSGEPGGSDPGAPRIRWREHARPEKRPDPRQLDDPLLLEAGPRTVVVAGDGAGPAAEELSYRTRWPLLAEATSGARFGRTLVPHYRELLADPQLGGRIERVVVFGHPTLSREIPALCAREDVEVIVVTSRIAGADGDVFDPGGRATAFAAAVQPVEAGSAAEDPDWFASWMAASRALVEEAESSPDHLRASASSSTAARREFLRGELAHRREPVNREMVARAVWAASWPHDRLVLGASAMIRVVDRIVTGKKIPVLSNRGLAGIDGTVSTAAGVAIASQASGDYGVTRALIGDLTLLHDAGGLLWGAGESRPRLQLIVVNDGGGSIFETLEVAGTASERAFERVMLTPQSVDLAALAAAYGWEHRLVQTRSDLETLVTEAVTGPMIVEVVVGG